MTGISTVKAVETEKKESPKPSDIFAYLKIYVVDTEDNPIENATVQAKQLLVIIRIPFILHWPIDYTIGKDTTNSDGYTKEFRYIPFRILIGVDLLVKKDGLKSYGQGNIRLKFGEHREITVVLERD